MRFPHLEFNEEEAGVALYEIAQKLMEIDTLFSKSLWRFPPEITELVEKALPVGDLDPSYWSNEIRQIADTVLDNRLAKQHAAASNDADNAPLLNADDNSPQL